VLDRRHGLDAGFQRYDDELAQRQSGGRAREAAADAPWTAALTWEGWVRAPFFAWVHLFDPHAPYAAPGGAAGQDRAAYLDEVRYADAQLGRLLEAVAGARAGLCSS
jgi:membrane-anchored protein YejM (alkaline phosphatase superfamily)